ncbi:unnamed protein product [Effrenium voratum]|nr:unnamed protein product [Effrenium voratum]
MLSRIAGLSLAVVAHLSAADEVKAALDLDDQCSAEGCGLNAVQLRGLKSTEELLELEKAAQGTEVESEESSGWLKDITTKEKNHFKHILAPLQKPIVTNYQYLVVLDSYANYTMEKIENATGSAVVWNRKSLLQQEFWVQFQMRHEQLHAKLGDAERALGAEQNARVEEQHRFETVLSRLGSALEKAQALWLKDSAKLSEQIHEAKRDFSIEMDGETRGVARRLADGLEVAQRQMDELERKLQGSKAEVGSLCERLENTARAQNSELRDAEGRMMRQVNDVQTIQNGRMQQAAFDLKAELAKQDQVVSAHLRDLRQSQEEAEARWSGELQGLETRTLQKIQDTSEREREKTRQEQGHALESERAARLRNEEAIKEDQVRHLEQMREQVEEAKKELMEDVQNAEERLVKRLEEQVELERAKTREQIEAFIEEERSERLKAETERHLALQKRLQAHEELTLQRHNEHRARMESDLETQRRMLESQQLKDKQDLQKDLQDFVQEQRLMAGKLTEDLRSLGGDCKSLAENFEKHQMATEQRFASETAALAAQLSVASAAQSASLLRSQESLTGQLAEQKQQLQGDVAKVSEELDNMNGEILKLIDDEAAKVKEAQEALQSRLSTLEMAFTARTAALGDSDEKLEAQLTELARAFEEAMDKLRETVASDTGRLLEHFGRVQDDVQAVEAEAIRRCEEMAEAQTEGKMEADQMLGNLQANIGELSAKIEVRAILGDRTCTIAH